MKTGMMEVAGTKYPLSFSARVIVACNERYGSIDNIDSALENEAGDIGKVLTECFWLLAEMSRAGSAYQKLMGNDAPEPLTEDFLLDAVGADDIAELKFNIFSAITGDTMPLANDCTAPAMTPPAKASLKELPADLASLPASCKSSDNSSADFPRRSICCFILFMSAVALLIWDSKLLTTRTCLL